MASRPEQEVSKTQSKGFLIKRSSPFPSKKVEIQTTKGKIIYNLYDNLLIFGK